MLEKNYTKRLREFDSPAVIEARQSQIAEKARLQAIRKSNLTKDEDENFSLREAHIRFNTSGRDQVSALLKLEADKAEKVQDKKDTLNLSKALGISLGEAKNIVTPKKVNPEPLSEEDKVLKKYGLNKKETPAKATNVETKTVSNLEKQLLAQSQAQTQSSKALNNLISSIQERDIHRQNQREADLNYIRNWKPTKLSDYLNPIDKARSIEQIEARYDVMEQNSTKNLFSALTLVQTNEKANVNLHQKNLAQSLKSRKEARKEQSETASKGQEEIKQYVSQMQLGKTAPFTLSMSKYLKTEEGMRFFTEQFKYLRPNSSIEDRKNYAIGLNSIGERGDQFLNVFANLQEAGNAAKQ